MTSNRLDLVVIVIVVVVVVVVVVEVVEVVIVGRREGEGGMELSVI